MLGARTSADRAYTAALDALGPQPKPARELGREDYGAQLRDAAALATLASEGRAPQATIDNAVLRIDASRQAFSATSTQEDAWLVMAARSLATQLAAISLEIGGKARQGAYYATYTPAALDQPVTLANAGAGKVQAVISVSGAPVKPEPAAGV